jgi:hypothetical protein
MENVNKTINKVELNLKYITHRVNNVWNKPKQVYPSEYKVEKGVLLASSCFMGVHLEGIYDGVDSRAGRR